jgi:regulatory protein
VSAAACKRQALELLARREHTRRELARKLGARAYSEELIDATLDELEASGLVDAARFAEGFVRVRAARGQGPRRIRQELAERGIPAEQSGEWLNAGGHDWVQLARKARRKKFGGGLPETYRNRARQARFLQYRGFEMDQIDAALDPEDDSD